MATTATKRKAPARAARAAKSSEPEVHNRDAATAAQVPVTEPERLPTTRADAAEAPLAFRVPVTGEFRPIPVPGLNNVSMGDLFIRCADIPKEFDNWMEVNPRVPNRSGKGVLSGPVVKGIIKTLTTKPESMALRNQGIYILAQSAIQHDGHVTVRLTDPLVHGLVNGGHTYSAIREALDTANEEERPLVRRAFVRLHVLLGVTPEEVADIAEGLNRSKQVDDPSLANLQGHFDAIQASLRGKPGEDAISYHQGGSGEMYISEVLVFLEMFNEERFNSDRHPSYLYNRAKSALEFFEKDAAAIPSPLGILLPKLHDILRLYDMLRASAASAARRLGFEFGRMKAQKGASPKSVVNLPFLAQSTAYRVPDAWLYPMLAAFRANLRWDAIGRVADWLVPLEVVVPEVIDRLVSVCVVAHRAAGQTPDRIGRQEAVYSQCYDKVAMYLMGRQGKAGAA